MVMKKASGGDSPLWQGAGKSFWTLPISRRRRRRLAVCFKENLSGLRFLSPRRIYRRKGSVRRWARRPHHLVAWARGRRATLWCTCLLAPLHLCFGLCLVSGKIGTSAFVSSISENISFVAFLKHKIAENRELALWHLISRLVLENA
jgi:hypothetical protein